MKVNGGVRKLEKSVCLEQFLKKEGYDLKRVAVELNGRIVPIVRYADEELTDADTLEIVHFVGGG